jgi:NTE family protein
MSYEIFEILKSLQHLKNKKILILSGGGFKGISYIGAFNYLQEIQQLNQIFVYAGTSIGSVFVFLLNIGFTVNELEKFIMELNFKKLISFSLHKLCKYNGLNDGKKFIELLKKALKYKNLNTNITFKELFIKTKKLLFINSSNITQKKTEYFNFFDTPDFKVVNAIRMSISLPIFLIPVFYNNNYYVDGGLTESFLYNYIVQWGFNSKNIIGIALFDKHDNKKNNLYHYLLNIYYTSFVKFYKNLRNIIYINIPDNNSFTTFYLTKEKKKNLINIGYNETKNYFNKKYYNIYNTRA